MSTATAVHQRDGWTRLTFAYHKGIVEALKIRIPTSERRWEPETKRWLITRVFSTIALEIVRSVYPDLQVINEYNTWDSADDDDGWDDEPPAPIRVIDPSYAELHLLPTAPAELIEAAYRTLARIHHPDRGGDVAVMQRLNAAHDRLKLKGAA